MKKYKWLIIVVILLLAVIFYFISPIGHKQQSVNFKDVKDVVTKVKDNAKEIKSYKINTEISAGSLVKVNMTDSVVQENVKRQLVDVKWEAPQTNGNTMMYSDGKQVYVFHPVKNKWVLPNEDATISPYIDFFWGQLGLIDPLENLLKVDPNGKNVKVLKEQNNSNFITIEVTPDPEEFSDIMKQLPPQLSGAELKDLKQIFTISKTDLKIAKYEVKANISLYGIKALKFLTVSVLSDYNKTTISLPPELADKIKQ